MTKKEWIDKRSSALAEIDKLTELSKAEKRSMSDEETKRTDELLKQVSECNAEIEKAEKDEQRAATIEAEKKRKFAPVSSNGIINEPAEKKEGEERKQPTIPASVETRRNLSAFRGEDANLRAYRAGRWIAAALYGHDESRQWCADHGIETRAQASNNNFLGGVFVLPEFSQAIIDLREERGVFRRESNVVSMSSDTLQIPRRTGGLTAYFVNESAEVTASDMTWDSVTLTAKKIGVLNRWPSELDEDAIISIADKAAMEAAYAFADKEDSCGFNGDGTSTYGGIYGLFPKIDNGSYTASIYTAATGNTAFSTLDLEDFEGVVGKCPLYARGNAKWYISAPGFSASMQRLMYAAGGNTVGSIAGGTGLSFLGYPVVLSQVLNSTLTTQTSTVICLFGDLRLATTFGNRRGIRMEMSNDRYFEYDQRAVRAFSRFDIVAHDLGSTSVAGPIVGLKTPGA